MARVSEQDVFAALKAVTDPDKGQDIVALGMVSGVVVKDGNVGFAIEVDPKRGAEMEPLRKQAEEALNAALAETQEVLDNIDYGVFLLDRDLRCRLMNKVQQELA